MFFILRSTFFLGLVFWAMPPAPSGSVRADVESARQEARAVAISALPHASKIVDTYCQTKPAICLQIAAELANSGKEVSIQSVHALARNISISRQPGFGQTANNSSTLTVADLAIPIRR